MALRNVSVMCLCPTTEANVAGRYFRAETMKFSIREQNYKKFLYLRIDNPFMKKYTDMKKVCFLPLRVKFLTFCASAACTVALTLAGCQPGNGDDSGNGNNNGGSGADNSPVVESGRAGASLTWTLTRNGTLTISGTGDMYDAGIGRAPWYYCKESIKKVVIEKGATSIGDHMFWYCYNMANITIPDGVASIGERAFLQCGGLTGVTIPQSVTSIEKDAFCDCQQLTSITIPNGVTNIEYGVFMNCYGLKSVIIPNSVISIGENAFYQCFVLENLVIPGSVTSIERNAFAHCKKLSDVTINGGQAANAWCR